MAPARLVLASNTRHVSASGNNSPDWGNGDWLGLGLAARVVRTQIDTAATHSSLTALPAIVGDERCVANDPGRDHDCACTIGLRCSAGSRWVEIARVGAVSGSVSTRRCASKNKMGCVGASKLGPTATKTPFEKETHYPLVAHDCVASTCPHAPHSTPRKKEERAAVAIVVHLRAMESHSGGEGVSAKPGLV